MQSLAPVSPPTSSSSSFSILLQPTLHNRGSEWRLKLRCSAASSSWVPAEPVGARRKPRRMAKENRWWSSHRCTERLRPEWSYEVGLSRGRCECGLSFKSCRMFHMCCFVFCTKSECVSYCEFSTISFTLPVSVCSYLRGKCQKEMWLYLRQ